MNDDRHTPRIAELMAEVGTLRARLAESERVQGRMLADLRERIAERDLADAQLSEIDEHRGALTGLLEHAEQRLEDADRPHKVDSAREEIAALRAVLAFARSLSKADRERLGR